MKFARQDRMGDLTVNDIDRESIRHGHCRLFSARKCLPWQTDVEIPMTVAKDVAVRICFCGLPQQ